MKKSLRCCFCFWTIFLSVTTLYGMRQRCAENFVTDESVFESMPQQEQELLVYDAITNKDALQLSLYLVWGWPCDAPLHIAAHPRWNALAWAIFLNQLPLVKLLVIKGANIAAETDPGITAFRFAHMRNKKEISEFLADYYLQHITPTMVHPRITSNADTVMCACGVCCMCLMMMGEALGWF
ncbi:MAG: ankyrin repeat domain-containing protein [Candidatus Babeliales bacterium]